MGEGAGLLRAVDVRAFGEGGASWGCVGKQTLTLTERTCVCARALAILCAFVAPQAISGPGTLDLLTFG